MRRVLDAGRVLLVAVVVLAEAGPGPVELGAGARFAAESTVLLGAEHARGRELGYRLRAALAVRPLLLKHGDVLLHFTLESPQLLLRGAHARAEFVPRGSLWAARRSAEFLARWTGGLITDVYLDATDPPDVLNYKKALISLFQFRREEGERNETDVSGECEVHYEAAGPRALRKFKHRCSWEGSWDADETDEADAANEADEAGEAGPARTTRRRALRYEFGPSGELTAINSDEVLLLHGADAGSGLKARALTQLTLSPDVPTPLPPVTDLSEALAQYPALTLQPLPLQPKDHVPDPPEEEPSQSLEALVREHRAALEDDRAGSAGAAEAALALLPALRRASGNQLTALLHRDDSEDIMEGLARVLGLTGAAGAHSAAEDAFQLRAASPPRPELAREYLAALALAPQVQPAVARAVLKLAAAKGELAPAALLAAAAVKVQPRGEAEALQLEVKDYALKSLAKCKEESCRLAPLLALAQLRRGDVGALLLAQAARGGRPALAALAALKAGPKAQLRAALPSLERLALQLDAPVDLEVRAQALQLLVEAVTHPGQLVPLAAALRTHGPRELRRVLRLKLLAKDPPTMPELLSALDPRPLDWSKRAHDGTSLVLERSLGALQLRSAQLAERGLLRRSLVSLHGAGRDLLAVEVWTRGLESLAPAEAPPPRVAAEPEDALPATPSDDVEAGLALSVAGTRRPDVMLFTSQGELLGHVWAGTGSEPTAVLRAVRPRSADSVHALTAGLLLRASADNAVAVALDAHAVVSLWGRNARAGLALRGAAAARLTLRARTAWGRLEAKAKAKAAPSLDLDVALDFYGAPQLCVRTAQPDYEYSRNVTLESIQGAQTWRVRRSRAQAQAAPGRTLALGARNDRACAKLAAAHSD